MGRKEGGRRAIEVVEISPVASTAENGLCFKSYMRDVMSGKFRDVIH